MKDYTPHMKNNLEFWMALRHLRARKGAKFISLITYLSTGGVAVGVAALIIVYAVMSGYISTFRDKLVGMNSHISIYSLRGPIAENGAKEFRALKDVAGVVRVNPVVLGQGMIESKRSNTGGALRGVDTNDPGWLALVGEGMIEGEISSLISSTPSILLGTELARELGVNTGDQVRVTIPTGKLPRSRLFSVGGIFSSGMYDFDSTFAFLSIDNAASLLGMEGKISALDVRVENVEDASSIAGEISKLLGADYWVSDWKRLNRNMLSALGLQKVVLLIILGLIVVVAAFNVAATLIMVVLEKTREIGILKAMGASSKTIRRLFALQGIVIGAVGSILGVTLGNSLCWVQNRWHIIRLPGDIYLFDEFPIHTSFASSLICASVAIALCYLATIYPSWRASRLDPIKAIRVD
ncbi:MAG: lipoprotein-releasing system transmembrane subunit LolC [Deltaproteobacteria bacterium]|nr:MAG: lipoprotein-releasing system transmembrane subunit LolC [Deltaproteobacteria bacterium]